MLLFDMRIIKRMSHLKELPLVRLSDLKQKVFDSKSKL